MDSIGQISQNPSLIYRPNPDQNSVAKTGGTSSFSQLEKISAFKSQEADLTILTKEGDYVTISADSEFRLDFATYDQTGRMKGGTSSLHAEALSVESSQKFSISVNGDLNDQEIKDIQNVLQSLDKITSDLLSGRLDQGMTEGGKLGNLGSLSSVEATLQVKQSISVEKGVMAQTISAPNEPTNQAKAIEKPIDPKALDVAQHRMTDTLRNSDLSSDKMAQIIEKFLLKLSQILSKHEHHDSHGKDPIGRLRNHLLKEIGSQH